jgi:hypothetical protein
MGESDHAVTNAEPGAATISLAQYVAFTSEEPLLACNVGFRLALTLPLPPKREVGLGRRAARPGSPTLAALGAELSGEGLALSPTSPPSEEVSMRGDWIHVDEIGAWSWIAASALLLIVLSSILSRTVEEPRVTSELNVPAPLTVPPLVPSDIIADPRV